MKKITCLVLVLLLSLGACIGAYAQESIVTNLQNEDNEQEKAKMEIVNYIMSLSVESRKSLIDDPENFVKNDKKLSKLVSSLSNSDKKEFYCAFQDNDNGVEINEVENDSTISVMSIAKWEKWMLIFEELISLKSYSEYVISKHICEQAIKRGITPEKAVAVLEDGRHCIDIISGARVVWDKGRDIAIIIGENTDKFVTIYNDISLSKYIKWATNNWKW